tara:strand:- start:75 stop:269 length:195 start_codon:yes stop_codon:yes gene_type:complete
MTLRTHTIKKKDESKNQVWEWEETPELLAAIEQLHKSSELVKKIRVPTVHVSSSNFAPRKKRKL